jgi:putative GTP pyrophosphokinase
MSEVDDAYAETARLYEILGEKVRQLLVELIADAGVPIHSVDARVKERQSLEVKVSRDPERYRGIVDVMDFLGLRVITYFPSEVDDVARIVEQAFDVEHENSIDRRAALDPDRFGYLSLHYVCRLSPQRLALPEMQRFKTCCFEIQIRSILQHAWAEIEHDLGYKTAQAVPREVRRSFARLAGILELADEQFEAIRDNLVAYRSDIDQTLRESPERVEVNRDSLTAFVEADEVPRRIDRAVAEITGDSRIFVADGYAGSFVAVLQRLGLTDIHLIKSSLEEHEDQILVFVREWGYKGGERGTPKGICLFYLVYVLLGNRGVREDLERYVYEESSIDSPQENLVDQIIEVAQRTKV